jgi:hypothetical protein
VLDFNRILSEYYENNGTLYYLYTMTLSQIYEGKICDVETWKYVSVVCLFI